MSQISSLPVSVFEHSVFGSIRMVDNNGDLRFVAKDVAAALEYAEGSNAARVFAHIPDEWKGVNPIHTPGGEQETLTLSEQGLYFFLARSDKPKALPFQKWLAGDVLPTIRRHGAYLTPSLTEEILTNPDTLIRLATDLKAERERRAALEAQVTQERPLVNFAKAVQASEDTILVKQLAGFLKQNGVDIGQNRLFEWMRQNGYLCRERGENWNKPTQRSLDLGLFQLKESISLNPDGTTRIFNTAKVTGKGQCYFLKKFGVKEVA
jgi:anti-repressor protein